MECHFYKSVLIISLILWGKENELTFIEYLPYFSTLLEIGNIVFPLIFLRIGIITHFADEETGF